MVGHDYHAWNWHTVTFRFVLIIAGASGADESMPQVQLNHIDPDDAGGADIQHVIETWLKQQARFRLPGDRETVIYPLTFKHQTAAPSGLHSDATAGSVYSDPQQPEAHANTWVQGVVDEAWSCNVAFCCRLIAQPDCGFNHGACPQGRHAPRATSCGGTGHAAQCPNTGHTTSLRSQHGRLPLCAAVRCANNHLHDSMFPGPA
jgi:hypothetical protein